MHERLFKLEREAEQRVHEARDREIDLGGAGSGRRASEAMNAPMLEVAKIRKMRQYLGDKQMEIDHQSNLLRRTSRNPDLPRDVKRYRADEGEAKLAKLTADYRAVEAEAEDRFFGGATQIAESAMTVRDDVDPEKSALADEAQERFPDKWAAKGWGGPRGPYGVPVLNDPRDRVENILADKPVVFEIEDNSNAEGGPPNYANDNFGASVVVKHKKAIEDAAKEFGIDADLIRAIMFVENSHGWYDVFDPLAGREPKSILPMNINPEIWGGLGFTRETANDPVQNIEAGARLLKELWDRIENPTPRKVAALWQYIGAERSNHPDYRDYVARVGRAIDGEPWKSWKPPASLMDDPGAMP